MARRRPTAAMMEDNFMETGQVNSFIVPFVLPARQRAAQ
jgi:hypothetical protein